jgi:hypothetical protein
MLVEACIIAKEEMIVEPRSTWDQCCKKSIKMANRIGMTECANSLTLQRWHHSFMQSPEGFSHSNAAIANGIGYLPPILSYFPEIKGMIRRFALVNLASLTRERVHDYLHTVVLPHVLHKHNILRNIMLN